ncbi:hypothetical protein ACWEFD_17130 [Streptomyces ardesiacus]
MLELYLHHLWATLALTGFAASTPAPPMPPSAVPTRHWTSNFGAHVPPAAKPSGYEHPGSCTLKQRLYDVLADEAGAKPPKLHAFHDALNSTERASTVMLAPKGVVSTILLDRASGRRPLTHEALAELPEGKVVEHIHSVLVATEVIPQWGEHMGRLERLVKDLVTSHVTVEGRKILH